MEKGLNSKNPLGGFSLGLTSPRKIKPLRGLSPSHFIVDLVHREGTGSHLEMGLKGALSTRGYPKTPNFQKLSPELAPVNPGGRNLGGFPRPWRGWQQRGSGQFRHKGGKEAPPGFRPKALKGVYQKIVGSKSAATAEVFTPAKDHAQEGFALQSAGPHPPSKRERRQTTPSPGGTRATHSRAANGSRGGIPPRRPRDPRPLWA